MPAAGHYGNSSFFRRRGVDGRALGQELSERQFIVKIAIGDSVAAAWLAAHFLASSIRPAVIAAGQLDRLLGVPVEGLRIGETSVKKLHRLGITTIRQILSLDRSSLLSRFGGEINLRLDQLTGKLEELIIPCRAIPKFQVEQFLEYGIKRPQAVEQWWSFLLKRLVGLLQRAQLGTRHLRCQFITEKKTRHDVAIRLCEAAADARQIGDLLRLKLEGLRLDAPLAGIRMEALETSPLERPQQEFFAGRPRNHVRRLSALLNRLCNRLGHEAVVRPKLLPDAVPERAVMLVPAADEDQPTTPPAGNWFLPLDRPTSLLPRPKAVEAISIVPDGPPCVLFWDEMRLEVARLWGPERIEAGWWQDFYVRRDYYRVETADGRRFWVFRLLQDQQWFLHGEIF